ncbi:MAG TPA: site-2 protease family protein [Gaiellaceae bacterium]|nr:site-2 protease family protein [Gaiellaceae bacterium]
MDRTRLVSARAENDRGLVRRSLERIGGLAVVLGGAALKWGFLFAKVFAFFVSFAAYAFWFGSWQFGLGFVLLILVHELGHVAEARRQGLPVSLPTFIPFVGAFVTVRHAGLAPWRSALVALAGPLVGGLAAAVAWAAGSARDTAWLVVLANLGFLLNAFNLLPIGFLDGGTAWHAAVETWRRPRFRYEQDVPVEALPPDRSLATGLGAAYLALAALLVGGLLATRHSGML